MTKKQTIADAIKEVEAGDIVFVPSDTRAAPKVIALCDQLEVAKRELYAVATSGADDAPVPDVLKAALQGDDDVLLVVWRAWDIYATRSARKWIIRADRVR